MASPVTLHLITPTTIKELRNLKDVTRLTGPSLRITHSILEQGPPSVECALDTAMAVPHIVKRAIEAEKAGADGIIIDCMDDPGIDAVREAVNIPVFGPCETSMLEAAKLVPQFSIVSVLHSVRPLLENNALIYRVNDKLASIKIVDIPVIEIVRRFDEVKRLLAEQALKAVEEDGARLIILGCTGFLGCADTIEEALKAKGHGDVQVIDPIPFTVRYAEKMLAAGLMRSEKTYELPRGKVYDGYDFLTSHMK